MRALIYFAIWIGLAYILTRWSREQDERGAAARPAGPPSALFSGPGLVLYVARSRS